MQQPPGQPGPQQQPPQPGYPGPQQPYGQPPGQVMYSPDGRWWWDGRAWQPVMVTYAPPSNNGCGVAAIVTVAVVGVLVLIAVVVIVLLTVVGHQVNNVFSNISSGLGP